MDIFVIYYTGIGDYRETHNYTCREFIELCNQNQKKFNYEFHNLPYPQIDSNNYSLLELQYLISWTGAVINKEDIYH